MIEDHFDANRTRNTWSMQLDFSYPSAIISHTQPD